MGGEFIEREKEKKIHKQGIWDRIQAAKKQIIGDGRYQRDKEREETEK